MVAPLMESWRMGQDAYRPGAGVDECPRCGSDDVWVKDTRPTAAGRRRRKRCRACALRWNTLEVHEERLGLASRSGRRAIESGLGAIETALACLGEASGRLSRLRDLLPEPEPDPPDPESGEEAAEAGTDLSPLPP
jgi:hypothetical protein